MNNSPLNHLATCEISTAIQNGKAILTLLSPHISFKTFTEALEIYNNATESLQLLNDIATEDCRKMNFKELEETNKLLKQESEELLAIIRLTNQKIHQHLDQVINEQKKLQN
jgi:hypothetical protein